MNAKKWLGRARFIDREIDILLKTKAETYQRVLQITQNYESDGAQTTKNPHKYDCLVEIENDIDNKIDELTEVKHQIIKMILTLDDRKQKMVLLSYYVRMKTFEQIAVEMNYSFRQVHNIRKYGILEVQKILDAANDNW